MNTWAAMLAAFRTAFTEPGFAILTDLVTGWVCAPGRRTVTGMITVADPDSKRAHDAYHRLIRDGRWDMSCLWHILCTRAVHRLVPDGTVELLCDDTLFHHDGRKVNGAGTFRDAVRSTVKTVVYARGLNLVVICLRINPPWGGCPIAIPVNMRLHRKNDETTTIGHAAAMLRQITGWLPDRDVHLTADGAYATLARNLPDRVQLTCRMRRDAAIYQPAPPATGRRGRPRMKGDRLPTPTQLAANAAADDWAEATIDQRGKTVTRLLLIRDVLWYRVHKHHLVRLVIVRDPDGIENDDYFFTTDLTATGTQIVTRYAGRWPIEVCYRDVKQTIGGQDPQSWKRRGPERAAALSLWLHGMIWCWYLHSHPAGHSWTVRPWYTRKTTPSFLDALAALRKALWANRINATSYTHQDKPKITDVVLDTLAYAA